MRNPSPGPGSHMAGPISARLQLNTTLGTKPRSHRSSILAEVSGPVGRTAREDVHRGCPQLGAAREGVCRAHCRTKDQVVCPDQRVRGAGGKEGYKVSRARGNSLPLLPDSSWTCFCLSRCH